MKGKIGLVVGLGAGYVLGTRAGRERYEQIKKQWLKVWHLDPVQAQVTKVTDFAKSQAAAVPAALWKGTVKVVRSLGDTGGTPGQKLDAALTEGKEAAADVAEAAEKTVEAVEKKKPAASARKPAAKATKNSSQSGS